MRKLSNDELATRTRETNRRRSARQRERLTIAGRAALTVWVPVGLRSRFVNEAAAQGVNINELAERYLDAGLRENKLVNFTSLNSVEHVCNVAPDPDSTAPPPVDSVLDRDSAILELHSTGISLNRISAELATRGILTATGKPISVSTINRVLSIHNLAANGEKKGKNLN